VLLFRYMNITWFGQSCFQIVSPKGKDGSVKIVIDPLAAETGLTMPKTEADILIFTEKKYSAERIKNSDYFLINEPGEYDIKDVFIQGISVDSNIYVLETEGMRLCHLGCIKQKELTSSQVDKIGDIDILMVPVGEDAQAAFKIVKQIEPRLVIPMCYHIPKIKIKLNKLDDFLKVMGEKTIEPVNKLSIKKKDLPKEGRELVILKI